MKNIQLEKIARKIILSKNRERTNLPVVIVEGSAQKPELRGSGYYFTNKSGTIINHPNSYGWPMVYHYSTRRIEVGEEFLSRPYNNDNH